MLKKLRSKRRKFAGRQHRAGTPLFATPAFRGFTIAFPTPPQVWLPNPASMMFPVFDDRFAIPGVVP